MNGHATVGRRRRISAAFCVALCLGLHGPRLFAGDPTDADLQRMRREKRVALVIGNGDYRNFPRLDNPLNDARGVAAALGGAGFEVILKLDATRPQMLAALEAFRQALARADVGLFYFAGHAAQVDWRNYMVPVAAQLDADRDPEALVGQVAQEAVDLDAVFTLMREADKRLNIVVLDACRDNPFVTKAQAVSRSLSRGTGREPFVVGTGLARSSAPSRTFLAYATAPDQVASDGAGRNSPFSGALIAALKVPDLKLEETFKNVRNAVASATQQAQIPYDESSVFDDFYFHIPASATRARAQAQQSGPNTTIIAP